ncbi:hypothetical protein BC940DRAFT_307252 [Gongronella butleri]|nr:hypothetical protein BC940DRAFT_307252 [Gongronella butleri]
MQCNIIPRHAMNAPLLMTSTPRFSQKRRRRYKKRHRLSSCVFPVPYGLLSSATAKEQSSSNVKVQTVLRFWIIFVVCSNASASKIVQFVILGGLQAG